MSILYMALADGTTTLVLTDGVNFTINAGWAPGIAVDVDQRTVIDQIPINVLGAPTTGGVSDKGKVRVNYLKLLTMLRQIERGQGGDGGVVTLIYTSPNSAPARRIACQVTAWDPAGFPVDINAAENLVTHTIENVILTLEHRAPWVWQSYLYANLLANSAWGDISPGPIAVAGTAAWAGNVGYYGGRGLIRLTNTATGASSLYIATTIAVISGVPVTATWTAGWTVGVTDILFALIDSATTTFRSSSVNNTVTGSASITAVGRRFTAVVTPTITGNVRLLWQVTGPNGAITEIAEVFLHATAEEVWHLDTALEGAEISSAGGSMHPVYRMADLPPTPALADTKLTVTGIPQGGLGPTDLGPSLTCLAPRAAILLDYPKNPAAGMFTTVADAARKAYGGNVMRFTPALANVVYTEPIAAPTMLTGMGVTIDKTRELRLVLVLVNNSATATFSIYVRGVVTAGRFVDSRTVDIPPNSAKPIHVVMPTIFSDEGFEDFWLYFSSSVAFQTLDVDRVWALGFGEETSMVLTQTNYGLTNNSVMTFDPQTLIAPTPTLVSVASSGGRARLRTYDNPLLRSRSSSMRVIVDGISDGLWQYTSGGVVSALSASITRPPAFDAPI